MSKQMNGIDAKTAVKQIRSKKGQQPVGVLTMSGPYVVRNKDEILHLLRDSRGPEHEKLQAPSIRITEGPTFSIEATFTSAEMAREVGRALHLQYKGELDIQIERGDMSVRVAWWC